MSRRKLSQLAVSGLLVAALISPTHQSSAAFYGSPGQVLFYDPVERGSGPDDDIFLLNPGTRMVRNITDRAWDQRHPAWAPDGRSFAMYSAGEIYTSKVDGRLIRRTIEQRLHGSFWWVPMQSGWSPDGQLLVYTMYRYDEFSLDPYAMDWSGIGIARADGTAQEVLIEPAEGITHYDPSFSPDGKRILFTRYVQGGGESVAAADVYSMRIDGTGLRNLTAPEGGYDHRPRWTPEGRIVFVSRRTCQGVTQVPCAEIFEMDPDGSGADQLTQGPHDWSGDGFLDTINYTVPAPAGPDLLVRIVAVPAAAGEDREYELWRINRETGERVRVLDSSQYEGGLFDWQPRCTVRGTSGPDVLIGTGGRDLMCGLGGDDVIRGLGGDDLIFGHGGRDRLMGGPGADVVVGNGGRDHCDRDKSDHSRVC